MTLEVSDPKGNKVFKETRKASAFGIASADFVLASELNLGRYEIRAVTGAITTERSIEVKRYVLPKFKIRKATLEIPLADSITTWRASVDGISASGRMGSTEMPIMVFQDFFVDLELPVSLSLGDQVSVPLTCYNYLKEPQDIRLTVTAANWYESSARDLSLHFGPNEVKSMSFPIKVLRVGNHSLGVTDVDEKGLKARKGKASPRAKRWVNPKKFSSPERAKEILRLPRR